jgi:hypothetical protein
MRNLGTGPERLTFDRYSTGAQDLSLVYLRP